MSTNAFSQLLSREQTIGFHNSLLGMHPLRLDRVEPGTFGGQKEGQNPNAFALLLDLAVVLTNPGKYLFTDMPGGVIPNQQPGGLALRLQSGATPLQKLGRDGADWATDDETPLSISLGHRSWCLLSRSVVDLDIIRLARKGRDKPPSCMWGFMTS